jgi:uncharacterized protein (TIGR02246 family)
LRGQIFVTNTDKPGGTQMTSDTRREIESVNGQFMTALKSSDATAIASLYTSRAQILPANSDFVRGTAAIRAFWQNLMNMGLKSASLETIEVEDHGDTAIEVGRYRLLAAGDALVDHGKYIVVWKNDSGTWKVHIDIWTTSQPAAAS